MGFRWRSSIQPIHWLADSEVSSFTKRLKIETRKKARAAMIPWIQDICKSHSSALSWCHTVHPDSIPYPKRIFGHKKITSSNCTPDFKNIHPPFLWVNPNKCLPMNRCRQMTLKVLGLQDISFQSQVGDSTVWQMIWQDLGRDRNTWQKYGAKMGPEHRDVFFDL